MLSIGALTLALLSLPAFCAAQQRGEDMRQAGKASPKLMTGKVTQVDASAKSFTIVAGGKSATFSAARLKALPAIGDVVDVTYVVTPGGAMEASNLDLSKSNVN
jgi:hypothetical protein